MTELSVAVAQQIATTLAAAPISLTYGANVRAGPIVAPSEGAPTKAVPGRCVFVLRREGLPMVRFKDGGIGTGERRPGLQIVVRSTKGDYTAGLTLALAVFDAVDMIPPTGYFDLTANASSPDYVGMDDAGHHLWTINMIAHHDPT